MDKLRERRIFRGDQNRWSARLFGQFFFFQLKNVGHATLANFPVTETNGMKSLWGQSSLCKLDFLKLAPNKSLNYPAGFKV